MPSTSIESADLVIVYRRSASGSYTWRRVAESGDVTESGKHYMSHSQAMHGARKHNPGCLVVAHPARGAAPAAAADGMSA